MDIFRYLLLANHSRSKEAALTMKQWLKPNRSPSADRPWRDVEDLLEQLATIADRGVLGRELYLWVRITGCSINMKIQGVEYRGEGHDPWEAAADLASKATTAGNQISQILSKHQVPPSHGPDQ